MLPTVTFARRQKLDGGKGEGREREREREREN